MQRISYTTIMLCVSGLSVEVRSDRMKRYRQIHMAAQETQIKGQKQKQYVNA